MFNRLEEKAKSVFSFSVKLVVLTSVLVSQPGLVGVLSYGSGHVPMASAASSPALTTYIVPAISDTKILPTSAISSSYQGNAISASMSPGEYKALSFVVNSNVNLGSFRVEASNLSGVGGSIIAASNVDIKAVKVWYQGSADTNYMVVGRYLTPELLLKDDSLVKVQGDKWGQANTSNPDGKNYLKVNGSYIDISNDTPHKTSKDFSKDIPISERPIKDAATLQPINLPANYNKQFWITLYVPENTAAGDYKGTISLKNGTETLKSLSLALQVLLINLEKPNAEYSTYYYGVIRNAGSVSAMSKTPQQYAAEMKDMLAHGVTNPNSHIYEEDVLAQELSIRQQAGMDNTNFYNRSINDASTISHYKTLLAPYGVVNFWMYGPDEKDLNTPEYRAHIDAVHKAGGKYFNAQTAAKADSVADILDLAVVSYALSPELAAKYHSYGHKVYSYAHPQVAPDLPRLFRQNYGLSIWQADYDGVMDYIYQGGFGDTWNDFDYFENDKPSYRDYGFTYPTANGVIDTIKWEGFREGVNDMRYLATLQKAIKAKGNKDAMANEAQKYLVTLKGSSLTNQNLDAVRSQMIKYILALQPPTVYTLTVNGGTGSGSYAQSTKVTITANPSISEKVFDKWTGDTAYITDINSASTSVILPNKSITVTAAYKDSLATTYVLTVNGGTGSGSYAQSTKVNIVANPSVSEKVFDKWTGDTAYVADVNSASTTVTMPARVASLTATYKDSSAPDDNNTSLPVISSITTTLSSGNYATGAAIPITINFSKSVTGSIATATFNTSPVRTCTFSVSNAISANCIYTIQAGDSASILDVSVSGVIRDQSGRAMTNFTPASSLSGSKTISINSSTNPSTTGSTDTYSTGALLKISSSSKVYVIKDGKKKWISTPEVFEQLGYQWTNIKVISETELNNLSDYEDNLIRQAGDYKVYLVVDGVKRHIPNPEVFLDYGFSWNDVKEVDSATSQKYRDMYLIKESKQTQIYYVNKEGIRKLIPTTEIFNSYNDKWEDVQIVSKKEMENHPLSNLIKPNNGNDIYFVENNVKKRIPNSQVFNQHKFNWSYVFSVNQAEFDWYQTGETLR